ncbi:hypothetical protein EJ06DRAFT_531666 [Trichodelitschia bisporula]|uniref:Uncharacterized protein n=1 Tax=Trichodelitschia bisporula TaxID=703511 RepID=A0A6G1HRU1_9PEZI|nr:hypothetical protein EJ06DRAFT_531666 [Trichodelitschia bisporula]
MPVLRSGRQTVGHQSSAVPRRTTRRKVPSLPPPAADWRVYPIPESQNPPVEVEKGPAAELRELEVKRNRMSQALWDRVQGFSRRRRGGP